MQLPMPNRMRNAKLENPCRKANPSRSRDLFRHSFLSYSVVMVVKVDVSRSQAVAPNELLVAGRPLVLGVPCQHALEAHGYTLHVLHRTPSLVAQ